MKETKMEKWKKYCQENNLSEKLEKVKVKWETVIETEDYGNIRVSKLSQESSSEFEWEAHAPKIAFDEYDAAYIRSSTAIEFLETIGLYLVAHDIVKDLHYTKLSNGYVFENTYVSDGSELLFFMLDSMTKLKEE